MVKLYVTEYAYLQQDENGRVMNVPQEPAAVEQTPITISGASAQSAAFGAKTRIVRVHTDAICSIVFGDNPTATTNHKRLAADQTEYFGVAPGQKLAVIANT
jgi:hypothetical protein